MGVCLLVSERVTHPFGPAMKTATKTNQVFAFHVYVADRPDFCRMINHRSAGKAKAEFLSELNDPWPDYRYTDLRAQKLGPARTSEDFKRNARYRGVPDVECGQPVKVGNGRGVIVGHNSSANFDVLFDDDSPEFAGLTLNCHPGTVEYIDQQAAGQKG